MKSSIESVVTMVLTSPAFFFPVQSSGLVRMNFTLLVTRFLQVSSELDFPSKFSDFPFLFLALFGQDVALLTPLEVVAFQILKTFPLLTPLEVVVLFRQGITVLTPLEVVAFQILKTFPLLTPLEVVVLFGQSVTLPHLSPHEK